MLGLLFALPMVMKAEAQLQRISVNLEDVSVVTLIKELKRQTGLDFLYNVDEVTRNGNVSVSVKDVTVEEVLKASLSEKGLGFSIVNDVIVIKPLEGGVVAQQEELVVIKGVVKDGRDSDGCRYDGGRDNQCERGVFVGKAYGEQ